MCFLFFARETAGASSARHSLRPLIFQTRFTRSKLERITRRDRGGVGVLLRRIDGVGVGELSRRIGRCSSLPLVGSRRAKLALGWPEAPGGGQRMSMREIPRLRHQPPPVTSFAPLTMRHPPHEDVGGIKTAEAVVLYAMTSRTIHTHKLLFRPRQHPHLRDLAA